MEQLEIFPLQSPCVGVCELNNKGYCKGCLRSREERFNWLAMTPAQQQEVMRLCRSRKARVEAARRKAQAAEAADPPPPPGWDFKSCKCSQRGNHSIDL